MSNKIEYKSLFDFLGKAAGPQLGKEVAKAAIIEGIPTQSKNVSNKQYKGEIKMYPIFWLEGYFGTSAKSNIEILYDEPDDLPF